MSKKVLIAALVIIGLIWYTNFVYARGLAAGVKAATK